MDRMLLVNPEVCLELWKNISNFYSATQSIYLVSKLSVYQKAVSGLVDKQRLYARKIKDLVVYVDALIEDNLYLSNKVWGIEPDTCTIYVTDVDRNDDVSYIPVLKTKNSYTYQSLCEILLETDQPKTVIFMLSERCNLNCVYCFEKHENLSCITIGQAKKFIDQMFTDSELKSYLSLDEGSPIIIEFMGGEPLIYADLIDSICDYFYECCIKYNRLDLLMYHQFDITTNGTLYFKEDVQYLLGKHPDICLSISLDGVKECHDLARKYHDGSGTFEDTLAAVKEEANRHRLRAPKMTFTPDTIQYLYKNVEFMSKLGYPSLSISPALEKEYTKEDGVNYYNELLKVADYLIDNNIPESFFDPFYFSFATDRPLDEPFCGGEGGMITLGPDGNYYTCHRMRGSNNCRSLVIGDLNTGLFGTEEYKQTFDYIRTHGIFHKKWPDKCEHCKFRGGCNGCPAINYENDGNLDGGVNTNGCYITLAKFAANIYYQAKRFGHVSKKYVEEHKNLFCTFLPEQEVETLIMIENM